MVLVLPGRKTFGSQFSQAFNPAFQQSASRFLESEDEKVNAKNKFENQKELERFKIDEKAKRKEEEYLKQAEAFGLSPKKNVPSNLIEPAKASEPIAPAQQEYNPANVSDEQILAGGLRNSQMANLIQKQKDAAQKTALENKKFEQSEKKIEQKEREFAHTSTNKYAEQVSDSAKAGKEILFATNKLNEALDKGATGAKPANIAFKYLDEKKSPFKDLFLTKDTQQVLSASKSLASGIRDQLFGSKMTGSEFFWAENILPSILKDVATNKEAAGYFKEIAQLNVRSQEIMDEIIKENKGYRPIDIDRQVRERLQPEINKTIQKGFEVAGETMVNVKFPGGSVRKIPSSLLDQATSPDVGGVLVQ